MFFFVSCAKFRCFEFLPLHDAPPPPQLMVFQMQFVSLLRMMEANITTPFMNFLDSLKWMNLHFEVDISFLSCDDEVCVCPMTNSSKMDRRRAYRTPNGR